MRASHVSPAVALLSSLPHGVAIIDRDGAVSTTNARWRDDAVIDDPTLCATGTPLIGFLRGCEGPQASLAEHVADGLARVLAGRVPTFQVQYRLPSPDDPREERWFLLAIQGGPDGAVVTRTDTTPHHQVDEVLTELAFHDPLTGLPNRGLILDRGRMALIRAQRLPVHPLIVFGDLDGFKAVNDTYGHEAGDAVLVETARRLTATIREVDTCGRWGGDELMMVLEMTDVAAAPRVVERIVAAMAPPFRIGADLEVVVGLSLGAVIARPGDRIEELVATADEAMYRAKRTGSTSVLVGPTDPRVSRR